MKDRVDDDDADDIAKIFHHSNIGSAIMMPAAGAKAATSETRYCAVVGSA